MSNATTPTAEDKAAAAIPRITYIHKVTNPHTGAVEFPENRFRVYDWVGYCIGTDGRSRVLGYSNARAEADAIREIARNTLSGTDVAVVPARPANAKERDAYLARRAALAPTDGRRATWARILTNAAIDYLRNGDDEVEVTRSRQHLAAMVDQAMHTIGDPHELRRLHVDHARRITTRAETAARMFLIVERDLDNRPRVESIEYRLTQYLKRRDELVHSLEAITPW